MQSPKAVKFKARMPPSQIPPAQVQAIIAEMRASGAYPNAAVEVSVVPPRIRGGRTLAGALGLLFVGAVGGAVVAFVTPGAFNFLAPKPAPTPSPSFMTLTPVPSETAVPVTQPGPASVQVAAAQPATPAPVLRPTDVAPLAAAPAKPKGCLSGGPCDKDDVAAAERRLRGAYDSARRAGVSTAKLNAAKSKWNTAKARSAGKPRTTVGAYRAIASDLYANSAKAGKPAKATKSAPSKKTAVRQSH